MVGMALPIPALVQELTCICFCGCDVWVAAGSTFSREPRAFSLPRELIIYSIYKICLYKIEKKNLQRKQESSQLFESMEGG